MGVIIYPDFSINGKGAVFAGTPFGAIFSNQNKWFIENESLNMIENPRSTIIRIRPGLPVAFSDWTT